MITKYKYGFEFNGVLYGWTEDWKLHKLPQTIKGITYSKKELTEVNVGNKKGYLVGCKRKTRDQLNDITEVINFEYSDYFR